MNRELTMEDLETLMAESAETCIGTLPQVVAEHRIQRELTAAVLTLVAVDGIAQGFVLSELHRKLLGKLLITFGAAQVVSHFRMLADLMETAEDGTTAANRALAEAQPMGRA